MNLLRFLLLFSMSWAYFGRADDFQVTRLDDKFVLETPSCEKLQSEVAAIAEWTSSLGELVAPLEINCKERPVRKADIASIVPAQFKQLAGKNAVCFGPNCFNAALIGHGLHSRPRSVGVNEISLTLELLCRDISQNQEPLKPGDIGVIRDQYGKGLKEVHAFNFIGNTVATKNGESISATLQIQDKNAMFGVYDVSPFCQNPQNSGRCQRYVSYFRCERGLIAGGEVEEFDALEHALADSLYNQDKVRELSVVQDLFELVAGKLPAERTRLALAKLESIEYQLKRMEGLQEEYLLDVIAKRRKEEYPAVEAFLVRAVRKRVAGESFPYIYKPLVQAIMDASITDFDDELKEALGNMTPTLQKKVRQHLKLPTAPEDDS